MGRFQLVIPLRLLVGVADETERRLVLESIDWRSIATLSCARKFFAKNLKMDLPKGTQRNAFHAAQKSMRVSCSVIGVIKTRIETHSDPHRINSYR